MNRGLQLFALLAAFWSLLGCQLTPSQLYTRLQFAPGEPQTRVLMIGDSLTYYNDLPGLLQQFSAGESAPIYIEQKTTALWSLKNHWDMDDSKDTIRRGNFTYVVLQDFSRKPVTDPEESLRYYSLFDGEARSTGAKTIVFENWTRKGMDDEFGLLTSTYRRIESQTHATPAPIGTAVRNCKAKHPNIPMLVDDRHPTKEASYLAACVLYDAIYRKKSSNLPLTLPGPKITQDTMKVLRAIADETMGMP